MEIYELNEDEKLILELLEGNLDEESRRLAFQKIAYNPALQEDFLDYISINKMMNEDANNIAVPVDYTNEIFAKIEAMQPLPNKYWDTIKRGITTSIFAMLMLLPLLFGVNNLSQDNDVNNELPKTIEQAISPKQAETNELVSSNNSKINQQQFVNKKTNPKAEKAMASIKQKANSVNANFEKTNNNIIVNENSTATESKIQNEVFNLNTNASNIAYANLDNSQKVSIYDENNEFGNIKNNQYDLPNFKIQKRELPPVIIQYHINSAITNPVRNMQKSSSFFGNYGISVFLETFPNISFGAEFGSEPYSQIYLNSENSTEYIQAPNVFYFGIAGRYDANQWKLLNIHPVAQLFAGGSSLGPLTRLSMQLEYDGIKYLGLYGGIEGGFLLYSNQGKWLTSKKVGAVVGANIKF